MKILGFKVVGLALSAGILGCSSMSDGSVAFREGLEQARQENDLHSTRCSGASSLAMMATEMERHDSAMDTAMGNMEGGVSAMVECSCCDTSDMRSTMRDLQDAESVHRAQMTAAVDLDTARSLCAAHTATLTECITQMRSMAGGCMMGH